MNNFLLLLFALSGSSMIDAQVFDFYNSIYFLSPDATDAAGTVLTNSGTNLSGFSYDNAPLDHPLYTKGVYYPVQDCGNNNIWVRVQHIAADPNGTENGQNISSSLHSPFLPEGSVDRIGGWNGFLYEFKIFADEVLQGTRTNVLNGLYPTSITVASLETLYNDGGFLYEWLSFEILNAETDGWHLNSINFTGINPLSNPGFSSELNYANTGTPTEAPIGFSTEFPTGSPNVYAVDMNLSNAYHSEFKMTASDVSVFRYGYEFTSGGYQGMSMAFGVAPSIAATISPIVCNGDNNASISLDVTGTDPIIYDWIGGNNSEASGLAEGEYTVNAEDATGCIASASFSISNPEVLTAEIGSDFEFDYYVNVIGGVWPYSYQWSTGETTQYVVLTEFGNYNVIVTDANGCNFNAEFSLVGQEEYTKQNSSVVYPNPTSDVIGFYFRSDVAFIQLMNSEGKLIATIQPEINVGNFLFNAKALPAGVYTYRIFYLNDTIQNGKLVKQD